MPEMHTLFVSQTGAGVSTVPENDYIPFTFAKKNSKGSYHALQSRYVHYANVDSGAQVCCVTSALLLAFPQLNQFF